MMSAHEFTMILRIFLSFLKNVFFVREFHLSISQKSADIHNSFRLAFVKGKHSFFLKEIVLLGFIWDMFFFFVLFLMLERCCNYSDFNRSRLSRVLE